MATEIINEILLTNCDTNKVKVYIDDYKAFIIFLGTCTGNGDNFIAIDKKDWDVLKCFIESNLKYSPVIDITPKNKEIENA